jgi:hypothetical protein
VGRPNVGVEKNSYFQQPTNFQRPGQFSTAQLLLTVFSTIFSGCKSATENRAQFSAARKNPLKTIRGKSVDLL